jgi:hypothetical protein
MKTATLLFALLAAILLAGCVVTEEEPGAIPEVVLTASDGAQASFPPATDDPAAPAPGGSFEKIAEATGTVVEDLKNVSATYQLNLDDSADLAGNLWFSVPLAAGLLPEGVSGAALQPMMDAGDGTWVPVGSLVYHDSASNTLAFAVNLRGKVVYNIPEDRKLGLEEKALPLEPGPVVRKFRVDTWLWTSALRSNREGSAFQITWYPAEAGAKVAVKSDAAWGNPSGTATDPAVPNMVEDLDAALNMIYSGLLNFSGPGGQLFAPLSLPQQAYITYTGDGAGESALGGPLKVSNTRIEGLHDLIGVAAHELVHVFQGQYYTGGTTGNLLNTVFSSNRWFIEACANYLPAAVLNYTDQEKLTFWTKDGDSEYLANGLTQPDDNNMYTAAHFLNYLVGLYGDNLLGSVMGSSSKATVALSSALKDAGVTGGLGQAYSNYGYWMVTHRDEMAGMNRGILNKLHAFNTKFAPMPRLKDDRNYLALTRPLAPLAMSYLEVMAANKKEGLLVATLKADKSSGLDSFTWGFYGNSTAAFEGKLPVDDPSKASLTFKDCGQGRDCNGLTRLLVSTTSVSTANITDSFYLLFVPDGIQAQEGKVTWSAASVGTIPAEFISGYNVFRDLGGTYERLGSAAYLAGGEQTYANISLKATDTLLVQVEDRFGNVWPEVEEAAEVELWISCRATPEDFMVFGCVRYLGPELDPESDQFQRLATQECLNNGYRQYYALAFEEEQACKDWCSQAAGDGTCKTPGEGGGGGGTGVCKGITPGNDVCANNNCYNCCDGCTEPVLTYECMSGCSTSDWNGSALCECNY